jgi:1-acyl-sn-glycerol-3-phosphate acyltransferase
MWRKKRCGHDLADLRARLLEEKCAYILFPEGKRTRSGVMGNFKAGIGMMVAGAAVPVVPCFLDGTYEAFPAGRWVPRFVKIAIHFGPPMLFDSLANDRSGWNSVARQTEAAVRALAAKAGIELSEPDEQSPHPSRGES